MGHLDGRIAIITGAGHGLGREHALYFAREGAKVVVNDLDINLDGTRLARSAALQVVEEITALGGEAIANGADVSDFGQCGELVRETIDTFGRVDVVVNNAGIIRDQYFHRMSEQEWDEIVSVHLKGHFCTTRHAVDHWRERSKAGENVGAAVINTTSLSGLVLPNPGQANYGAAKAGVAALTRVLAVELERIGVRVNAIAPAARTRMSVGVPGFVSEMVAAPTDPLAFDAFHPRHVSPLVGWLASAGCPLTGRVFYVQGGRINEYIPWTTGEDVVIADGTWTFDSLNELLGEARSSRADDPR